MACPHLEYRRGSDGQSFEEERAYCTVADRFVQPMRADICNGRYGLDHERDCEIYRAEHGVTEDEYEVFEDEPGADVGDAGEDGNDGP